MGEFTPVDEHDAELLGQVHPRDWQNPRAAERYNLVVVGAGPAGLVAAAGAAGLGAKVALIERHLMGGDCLNVGCVPSKALLRCARAAQEAREAGRFGVRVAGVEVEFSNVAKRVRSLRAQLSHHDSASRFQSLGVDVFLGQGSFTGPDTIGVGEQTLRFSKAIIATGARAVVLPIPGLKDAGCLTNETVFQLTDVPKRLAIIGAGPIGCEMAQAFARLGSTVWLFETENRILPREDAEAAKFLETALTNDGVTLHCGVKIEAIARTTAGKQLRVVANGPAHEIVVDEILLGVGRAPNIEHLNLEAAGIAYTKAGVTVNDFLQTSNRRVYAAGDVCLPQKFTHAADATARIVLQNALFVGRKKITSLVIPWCTYTDPEIAHVGAYESADVKTFRCDFTQLDRAVLDADEGFVKVHVRPGSDRILGATIVGSHAGEMIGAIALAMSNGLGLKAVAQTIFPYPTVAEGLKKAADAYSRTRLTPGVRRLFDWWLRQTR